jgi:hypothetical protein
MTTFSWWMAAFVFAALCIAAIFAPILITALVH